MGTLPASLHGRRRGFTCTSSALLHYCHSPHGDESKSIEHFNQQKFQSSEEVRSLCHITTMLITFTNTKAVSSLHVEAAPAALLWLLLLLFNSQTCHTGSPATSPWIQVISLSSKRNFNLMNRLMCEVWPFPGWSTHLVYYLLVFRVVFFVCVCVLSRGTHVYSIRKVKQEDV